MALSVIAGSGRSNVSVDLRGLNARQLRDLISNAQKRQMELAEENVKQVRERCLRLIADEGLTFEQVFGPGRAKKPVTNGDGGQNKKAVAPKYRNPANPLQTWAGRGKRPKWFSDALAEGITEAQMYLG